MKYIPTDEYNRHILKAYKENRELTPDRTENAVHALHLIEKRLNFNSLTPEIGMFVPAVEGVPIDEPTPDDYKSIPWCETGICKAYEIDLATYQAAKERVLFEGFEIYINNSFGISCINYGMSILSNTTEIVFYSDKSIELRTQEPGGKKQKVKIIKTLSHLFDYDLTLTPAGIKLMENGN